LAGTKAVLEQAKSAVKADEATRRKYSAIQDQQGKISVSRPVSCGKTNEQYGPCCTKSSSPSRDIKSNEDKILELIAEARKGRKGGRT
jgi:hypothetical protein